MYFQATGRPQLVVSSDSEQLTVFLNLAASTEFSFVLFLLVTNHFWGTLQQSDVGSISFDQGKQNWPLCVMTMCFVSELFKLEAADGIRYIVLLCYF